MMAQMTSLFRIAVMGLAVYGGLDLARTARADDPAPAYLPCAANAAEARTLEERVAALEDLLRHVSRDGNDIFVTGANLHVVNGSGNTTTTNGLGNVIVGYNEARGVEEDNRTGSHMVVVGRGHNYGGFGGIVAGYWNSATGPWSSVLGGDSNLASGSFATVSGGNHNEASGLHASVCGGDTGRAPGPSSSVSGGYGNEASGAWSAVGGGADNGASGLYSVVGGGRSRQATADYSWRAGALVEEN
jgi:hypothetical protein